MLPRRLAARSVRLPQGLDSPRRPSQGDEEPQAIAVLANALQPTLTFFDQNGIKYTYVPGASIGAIYGHVWDTWRPKGRVRRDDAERSAGEFPRWPPVSSREADCCTETSPITLCRSVGAGWYGFDRGSWRAIVRKEKPDQSKRPPSTPSSAMCAPRARTPRLRSTSA